MTKKNKYVFFTPILDAIFLGVFFSFLISETVLLICYRFSVIHFRVLTVCSCAFALPFFVFFLSLFSGLYCSCLLGTDFFVFRILFLRKTIKYAEIENIYVLRGRYNTLNCYIEFKKKMRHTIIISVGKRNKEVLLHIIEMSPKTGLINKHDSIDIINNKK